MEGRSVRVHLPALIIVFSYEETGKGGGVYSDGVPAPLLPNSLRHRVGVA